MNNINKILSKTLVYVLNTNVFVNNLSMTYQLDMSKTRCKILTSGPV